MSVDRTDEEDRAHAALSEKAINTMLAAEGVSEALLEIGCGGFRRERTFAEWERFGHIAALNDTDPSSTTARRTAYANGFSTRSSGNSEKSRALMNAADMARDMKHAGPRS